jgi:hypothetical protein
MNITNKNLQKLYESKIGHASFSTKKIVAGSVVSCVLDFTVGETGIDDSGSMKILFPIVTDFGVPQFSNPDENNFVSFESSNSDVDIKPISNATGFPAKIHIRPWSKGMQLVFKNTHLQFGDSIKINFKNWKVQTFYEKIFRIKILVDPFATDQFIELPQAISFEVEPDKPDKIVIIAPSEIIKSKPFSFLVKAEDRWGNACFNFDGEVSLVENSDFISLPKKIKLKSGKAMVLTKMINDFGQIQAKFINLVHTSNPILAKINDQNLKMFWADLHGQTEETVGTGTIEEYFNFAKDYSLLDITAHQGNDFQIPKSFWNKINSLSKKMTKQEKFVVFPGFEWSGNSSKGGDRNVLFLEEGNKIFRSSHALVEDISDVKTDAPDITDLFKKLKGTKHIVMAHVGGRYAVMDHHDSESERLVEVHSVWGTFEWILFEALKKGYKVGVMANSDGHDGRVGSSYPGFSEFNNYGGLTCVLAQNLTRNDIFNALRSRHCYGTTGNRMFIDEKVEINDAVLIMGDELSLKKSQKAIIKLRVCGTQPIDLIQVFDTDKCIHTWQPQIPNDHFGIKVLWSGSKVKGRNRKIHWAGKIKTDTNSFEIINSINFFNPEHNHRKNDKTIEFFGATTGGVQGLTLANLEKTKKITITVDDQILPFGLNKLSGIPTQVNMGYLDAKIEVSKVALKRTNRIIDLEIPIQVKPGSNIFVKITQSDGHMAWTSPVFFKK